MSRHQYSLKMNILHTGVKAFNLLRLGSQFFLRKSHDSVIFFVRTLKEVLH
jgi:hypothetical protein